MPSTLTDLAGARVIADAKVAYSARGPMSTVWLDVTKAVELAPTEIALRWRAALEGLAAAGAPEHHLTLLRELSEQMPDVPGHARRTVVVADDGVLMDVAYEVALLGPDGWEHGPLPRLVPLLRDAAQWVPYLLVEVGHTEGVLHHRVAGRAGERMTEVAGETDHARKVSPGGWSQRRWQNHVDEVWRGNAQQLAEEAARHAAGTPPVELVVVTGDVQVRPRLVQELKGRTQVEVVELETQTLPAGADDGALVAGLEEALEGRWERRLAGELDRIREREGVAGAVGPSAVVDCLVQSQVGTLLLRPDALLPGTVSALREEPWVARGGEVQVAQALAGAPADEALARAALLTDAEVLVVDDDLPELERGCAASLRWDRA